MDYNLYNRLPLVDIIDIIAGFFALERQREREAWERCRWQTATLFNIQVAKEDRRASVKLLPFPWDKVEEKKPTGPPPKLLTEEHRRKVAARMDREMRQKWEEEQRKKKANGTSGS